jgi:hypothetical protein
MASNFQRDPDFPIDFGGQQVPPQVGPMLRWVVIGAIVIALFILLSFLKTVYTDWLWFSNLGYNSIFTEILITKFVLFLVGTAIFAVLLSASVYIVYRVSDGPFELPIPEDALRFLNRMSLIGAVAGSALLSIIFGVVLASRWEMFLRYANAVSFGTTEPVFGRDAGFYVFSLPTLEFMQGWLLGAAIIILLASLGMYFLRFSVRGVRFEITHGVKVHVSIVAAILLVLVGAGHWLDRMGLVLSTDGAIFGAAYADVNARMPALLILTIIAFGAAALAIANIWVSGVRLLLGAASLWITMAVVLGSLWPTFVQQFTVTPNEFAREEQYIQRNLDFTRRGFGLENVEEAFFPAERGITEITIEENRQTINNIRLWDYRPLSDVYRQIQLIRPYYDFKDADIDRYVVDGQTRQVMLSAREIATERLDPQAQTWVNTRLVYTHGIGIAMSPVTEFTPEGRPTFYAQDIPAEGVIPIRFDGGDGDGDITVTNPRIYYGENTLDYVIVNTNVAELDYQTESGELFRTSYTGDGGVRMDSFIKRIAYAWQMRDINILISGEITGQSRIQYRRSVQERISTVAPFLRLDSDPYIVATNGTLFWIQDAFTVTDHFPYSDPFGDSFNYIRNSVKVTVDAFDGSMKFYVWDPSDPIISTYLQIFPELFSPMEDMPEELNSHVRYPLDLFSVQAEKYRRYHMRDAQNFYNNEDLWAIPNEKYGQGEVIQPVEPYYLVMRLPEEDREEFVLLMPFTPAQRQNLVGWLAARSDGENYGRITAFNFPRDRQVDGTEQVEARIDNDQEISAWFTLRCSEGATCIRGNLLVIPIGNSLIYAEPIYIQAQGVRFPELSRVILASGERVVMEDSLELALDALLGRAPGTQPAVPGGPLVEPGPALSEIETLEELIRQIEGDLAALEQALQRLKEISGGE